jgi:hypothetical protein
MLKGLYDAILNSIDQCTVWNPVKSIFDILDRQQFDLFFCEGIMVKPSVMQAIAEYNIPTVVSGFINFPGPIKLRIIPEYISKKIRDNVTEPHYVMSYAANLVKDYPKYPASNIVIYNTDQTQERVMEYSKVLRNNNILFKVVGNKVEIPEYVGEVDLVDIVGLCKTANINIVTNVEYANDIAAHKRLVLLLSALPTIENDLLTVLNYWTNTKEVQLATKEAYEDTIKYHTYYHHAYNIFSTLEHKEEAEKCLSKVSEF